MSPRLKYILCCPILKLFLFSCLVGVCSFPLLLLTILKFSPILPPESLVGLMSSALVAITFGELRFVQVFW